MTRSPTAQPKGSPRGRAAGIFSSASKECTTLGKVGRPLQTASCGPLSMHNFHEAVGPLHTSPLHTAPLLPGPPHLARSSQVLSSEAPFSGSPTREPPPLHELAAQSSVQLRNWRPPPELYGAPHIPAGKGWPWAAGERLGNGMRGHACRARRHAQTSSLRRHRTKIK